MIIRGLILLGKFSVIKNFAEKKGHSDSLIHSYFILKKEMIINVNYKKRLFSDIKASEMSVPEICIPLINNWLLIVPLILIEPTLLPIVLPSPSL